MDFIKHPKHSRFIGKPRDWDEKRDGSCGALSVHDTHDPQSHYPVMESAWMPSPDEIVAMALGLQHIRLGVFGTAHPVVYMGAGGSGAIPREDLIPRLIEAGTRLAEFARTYGIGLEIKYEPTCGVHFVVALDPLPQPVGNPFGEV